MDERINKSLALVQSKISEVLQQYADSIPARMALSAFPQIGGALDLILAGYGSRIQNERLQHFIVELSQRLDQVEKK